MERGADVVEAVHGAVERKGLLEIEAHVEQVADRVGVFQPIEPAEDDAAFGRSTGGFDRRDPSRDPFLDRLKLSLRRPGLLPGGHRPGAELLLDGTPPLLGGPSGEAGIELVETEVALRLLSGVAFLAMAGKERADLFGVDLVGRADGLLGRSM
jgi:hypothetical protein